jgi:transmembrane sensor
VGEGGSRLSFADGSYALLEPHAHVDIQAQAPSATAVVQHAGEVRYEVVHAPDREFVVHAKGIRVEVRGTSFSVTIDDGVRVVVHSGLVRVSDGRRALDLRRGESLEMANAPEAEVDEAAEDDESGVPSAVEPASGFDEGRSAASGAAETDPGAGSAPPHPTAAELLARADEARRDGQLALAARHLQQLLGDHPRDRRVPSALFTLGRIARTQGRYAEAAGRFAAYRERAPAGALYEDALAEEASSLAAAGERERARAVARHYLSRFAGGPHTARVQRLIE